MSKQRVRLLKRFLKECISIADAAVKENKLLQKEVVFHMKQSKDAELRIKELEETLLEQNKGISIGKRLINFFS